MNILIVDDHQLFLDGFCILLKKLNTEVSISACTHGKEALKLLSEQEDQQDVFDLIVMDLGIPDIDGLTLFNVIRQRGVMSPVVFISATENIQKIARIIQQGASGFIPKQFDNELILQALHDVIDGEIYIPTELASKIDAEFEFISRVNTNTIKLTRRQIEVLRMMADGISNKDIAVALFISEATVKSHVGDIYQVMGTNKRMECTRLAERLALI